MNKPTKQIKEYYDYIELSNYLKEKYSIGDDFWDWIIASWYGTHNGSFHILCIDEVLDNKIPDDKKDALNVIKQEFGDEIEIYLWW